MTPHEPIHGEYNPPEDRVEEPKEDRKSRIQSLRKRAGELREEASQREEERKEKKEVKRLEREVHHPTYSRVRREVGTRVRHGGARVERGAKHVYHRTEHAVQQVGGEIKRERQIGKQFPYGAPKVYARPTKARLRSPPSQTRQRESVNYGGSEPSGFARMLGEDSAGYQRPQIDLLGNSGQRKEINLMGNKGNSNKKKIRLI